MASTAAKAARARCSGSMERSLHRLGHHAVAGADEVGRGSLFGPVYAAAVVLDPGRAIRGLRDSKQLEPERREELDARIRERSAAWSIAAVDAAHIDRINIYQASRLAMRMAVEKLHPPPDFILVDALSLDVGLPQRALIRGDARCQAIAAASIIAKVARDACMRQWDAVFPGYGLARHKGYYTPEHLEALRLYGPTPLHRLSFDPVKSQSVFRQDGERQMELFA